MRSPLRHLLPFFRRHSSTSTSSSTSTAASPYLNKALRHVPYYHRPRVLVQVREALADYFHTTRSLPYVHADHIASNSPSSLSSLLSSLPFSSASEFPNNLRRRLAYRPINEFDFFFESIGVSPELHPYHGSQRGFFLSEETSLLSAVSALVQFGFPWADLGVLYKEERSIFDRSGEDLVEQLAEFERFGLDKPCLIGICLAFPSLLAGEAEMGAEVELLLRDLKLVLGDFDSVGSITENVDAYFRYCRRIRVFYDLGCKRGETGDLMKSCWEVFLKYEERDLLKKAEFFCRLGLEKEEAGTLLLQRSEVLEYDLENADIRMPEYLANAGFSEEQLNVMRRKYPFAAGRNKIGNLPAILRALDLNKWFIDKIRDMDFFYLSPGYLSSVTKVDEELDTVFRDGFDSVKSVRRECFLPTKLEFLQGIGFGENQITVRALRLLMGRGTDLKERFDCLLGIGIEYATLCRMISASPKILNQLPDMLCEKVNFLCVELGWPVQYLDNFPAFLSFDLENRVKPRYRMLDWLRKKGLLNKNYSPATVISASEKKYIAYLRECHPAAPKLWFELFKFNNHFPISQ